MRLSGENLRSILAACGAVLLLAACGGDDGGNGTTEAPETAPGSQYSIGLVTDVGQLNDRGFNQLAYQGLKRAQEKLGVKIRVAQSRSAADYVPNHTSLAREGFDLIIGVGFAQGEAVASAAKSFPDSRFAIIDVDQTTLPGKPRNVLGVLFREEEAGYLAGVLAALSTKKSPPVVSSVGGFKEPPVDRFIAGYQAGAKYVEPGIETLNGYSSDWEDQAKCKELALNQIARGATVVFQVAGGCGLGALDAAREKKVWGIGVDADQWYLGPHMLTSAVKRVDEAVYGMVSSVLDDTWTSGTNVTLGLADNGVGLGTIIGSVPEDHRQQLDDVQRKILSGEIQIPKSL
ncbi:MAG TPA: BMP family ABC transporter substrate-binding protein [Gaiellaceae bacterium]|nr:BMP family ABC transporter substrate-binding protein [Gaiellaceae bacterium]